MVIGPKAPKFTPAELARMEREARAIVGGRDQGKCVRCHLYGGLDWDHRQNRSQGGLWLPSNGQLLCRRCHEWKGKHVARALMEGWSVPGAKNPAEWPASRYVMTAWGTLRPVLVLYDDSGQVYQITAQEAAERSDGLVLGVAA